VSSVYAFRCSTPEQPLAKSTLVVFCGPTVFSYNDLVTAINEETRRALAPDAVYLCYSEDALEAVEAALRDNETAFDPLPLGTHIGLYGYDVKGNIKRSAVLRGSPPDIPSLPYIRRQGLTVLFQRRRGLLEAGPTAHFVKPSGKTDSRFLRASHALSEGAEIFFVALWLLPYLNDDVQFVHLDTSSIASIVLAGILMKRSQTVPTLRTFQSYRGLHNHPFSVDRADLVLISASQSGGMANLIIPRVKDASRIVTLFSTGGDPPVPTAVLCDLRLDQKLNPLGYPPAPPPADPKRTRSIRLIGEHFLAAPESARAVVPAKPDASLVVQNMLAQLKGQEVFKAYRAIDSGAVRRAIWVDVEKLCKTDAFRGWLEKTVTREIPAATRAIIYPDSDPSAELVGQALRAEIERQGGQLKDVVLLKLKDIESGGKAGWPVPDSPVLIVGGAAGHGQSLLAISRALRRFAPDSQRIYLSAATLPSSKRAFSLLESNLKQPSHRFLSMFEVFVDRAAATASWDEERDFLGEREEDLPPILVERLSKLRGQPEGITEGLFLDGNEGRLRLRSNFAFWPSGTVSSEASQADVFVSVAAILENLRSGSDVKAERRLTNDALTHTVLSGETFARYNDGVIQAALLRAALPVELDYCDAPEQSRLMRDLLQEMVALWNRPQGEALGEFLLALTLKRLRLAEPDLREIIDTLGKAKDALTKDQRWLATELQKLASNA
jgi:hypothetical protein